MAASNRILINSHINSSQLNKLCVKNLKILNSSKEKKIRNINYLSTSRSLLTSKYHNYSTFTNLQTQVNHKKNNNSY